MKRKGDGDVESETKARILDAMYALVAERGYERASIRQVCAMAKVTQPTVYYHFGSKEELFLAVVENLFPVIDPEDPDLLVVDDPGLFRQHLADIGYSIVAGYHDDEERRRVLAEIDMQATRMPQVNERQQRMQRSVQATLEAILGRGVEIGALPKDTDVDSDAQFLYVVVSGLSHAIAHRAEVDARAAWDRAVQAVLP